MEESAPILIQSQRPRREGGILIVGRIGWRSLELGPMESAVWGRVEIKVKLLGVRTRQTPRRLGGQ